MAQPIKVLVYPVKDLAAAKAFYGQFLGVEPYADSPYYVGYRNGDLEIGLDPNGQDIVAYIEVEDISATLKTLVDTGATTHQEAKDVGGGMLIAQVTDNDGNVLGLRQLPKA